MAMIGLIVKENKIVHVAVGVILDGKGRVFIAKRLDHLHQGGLWEFPGGKIDQGETSRQALQRELEEELGIRVTAAKPLIKVSHQYSDKSVLLDVWRIDAFIGQPLGCEGQEVEWIKIAKLRAYDFPAANKPIIKAISNIEKL